MTNPTITQRAESIAPLRVRLFTQPADDQTWMHFRFTREPDEAERHAIAKAVSLHLASLPPITDASASVGEGMTLAAIAPDLKIVADTMREMHRELEKAVNGRLSLYDPACHIAADHARLATLSPAPQTGWKLVPVEPTEAMINAHFEAHARARTVFADAGEVWAAMLDAAPQTREGEGDLELAALLDRHSRAQSQVTPVLSTTLAVAAERIRVLAALSASPPLEVVEALREAANEAVSMLAQAFGRIHSLPRTSDTELASRIVTAKEHLRSALSALQPDRFGLPGSASTADAACVAEATALVPGEETYRGYRIGPYRPSYSPSTDWSWAHEDFDGAPDANDNRYGYAASPEACRAEIDMLEDNQ